MNNELFGRHGTISVTNFEFQKFKTADVGYLQRNVTNILVHAIAVLIWKYF